MRLSAMQIVCICKGPTLTAAFRGAVHLHLEMECGTYPLQAACASRGVDAIGPVELRGVLMGSPTRVEMRARIMCI